MFKKGDYIIYGNKGVCRVEEIGTLNSPGISKNRIYYTLVPYFTKGSTIFTPADNDKVLMRPVISQEEALELIDGIREIEALWIPDEKRREAAYKEALHKCECRELVRIIKTIYSRKMARLASGKKVTAGDEKYFHMAEDELYGELAVVFDMDKEEAKEFVLERVKLSEEVNSR